MPASISSSAPGVARSSLPKQGTAAFSAPMAASRALLYKANRLAVVAARAEVLPKSTKPSPLRGQLGSGVRAEDKSPGQGSALKEPRVAAARLKGPSARRKLSRAQFSSLARKAFCFAREVRRLAVGSFAADGEAFRLACKARSLALGPPEPRAQGLFGRAQGFLPCGWRWRALRVGVFALRVGAGVLRARRRVPRAGLAMGQGEAGWPFCL